ncbi:MAG TPA: hypothetical protein VF144_01510 [Chitinophagaceae bacterium]
MKKIGWIAALLMLVTFSGCFDTVEELTINENGGGTYINIIDMGKILGLAKSMGGGNDDMKEFEKLKVDTVVNLKDIKDSLRNLTAADKKIVETGTLRAQVDGNDEKLSFTFKFPYLNGSEITRIQSVLRKTKADVLEEIMGTVMGEAGNKNKGLQVGDENDEQSPDMVGNIDGYYATTAEKGKISRTLNKEKYANVADDKSLKTLQEMAQMGVPINMKTIINLPKAAKKAEGKGVKLSDDKKKITIEGSLDDFFEDGNYFEYNIEY